MKWYSFHMNKEKALDLFFDLDYVLWTDFVCSKQFVLVYVTLEFFTAVLDETHLSHSHSPCFRVL